jgi:O-antigen/teichoic acid export membrane protein
MLEKIKELSKDTAIYGVSTMFGRFLGFLLTPLYTNFLGTAEYGIYSNVFAYLAFLNIVFIYGMDAAFMKYSADARGKDKKIIFSTAYIFVLASTVLLALVMYFLRMPLSSLMQIPKKYYRLYYYLGLILIFDTLSLVPYADLRLLRRASKFSVIRLSNIFLNIGLNFILVLKYHLGIEAIFLSNLAASVFSFILLSPEILNKLVFRIDKKLLRQMLKFAIPYLPASVAATIVQVIDRPVVQAMTNTSTLGIYNANYKLGIFMMILVSIFQFAWQPFILNNAKEKNAREIFAKILTLFLLVASIAWIVIALFVDDFARFQFIRGKSILGAEFQSGLAIVPIILLGYLFNGVYYNFLAGLYIQEKTKFIPIVTGAGAVINVAVNILFIPLFGIMGAALATLASYIVMAAYSYHYGQKVYRIEYEFSKVIKILILLFVTCGIYYYIYYRIGLNIFYKLILLGGFLGILISMRVVEKNEILRAGRLLLRKK